MKNITSKNIYKMAFGFNFLYSLGEDRTRELIEFFSLRNFGHKICNVEAVDSEIRCDTIDNACKMYITDYSCVVYDARHDLEDDYSVDWIAYVCKTNKLSNDEWDKYLSGLNNYSDAIARAAKQISQENFVSMIVPKIKQTDDDAGYEA